MDRVSEIVGKIQRLHMIETDKSASYVSRETARLNRIRLVEELTALTKHSVNRISTALDDIKVSGGR